MNRKDQKILRTLAAQVSEAASHPIMDERRRLWVKHNQLKPERPMILVFPEGSWRELLPESSMLCEDETARLWEWNLRSRLYTYAHFQDDTVLEKTWTILKRVHVSDWGVEIQRSDKTQETGSWYFIPALADFDDMHRLHFPQVKVDEEGSQRDLEQAQEVFGDILDVRQKGVAHISFHLAALYSDLRGLENTYTDMIEHPDEMLDLLDFLTRGLAQMVEQFEALNLLSLNNDDTYHSSGGVGYTEELPASGFNPERVRTIDMWSSAESQEYAVVSPRMHRRFALDFEKRLLARFGLNGYGCCEDLTHKLEDVLAIPNIRRISISPFANVEKCAEILGKRAIYSWKPQPQHLVGNFEAGTIHQYLSAAIQATRDCVLEIILKDTHTCENRPERFDEWTRIARSLVN
jgi:hypothetical protein